MNDHLDSETSNNWTHLVKVGSRGKNQLRKNIITTYTHSHIIVIIGRSEYLYTTPTTSMGNRKCDIIR